MGNISYNTIIKNKSLGDFMDDEKLGVEKSEEREDEVL